MYGLKYVIGAFGFFTKLVTTWECLMKRCMVVYHNSTWINNLFLFEF